MARLGNAPNQGTGRWYFILGETICMFAIHLDCLKDNVSCLSNMGTLTDFSLRLQNLPCHPFIPVVDSLSVLV